MVLALEVLLGVLGIISQRTLYAHPVHFATEQAKSNSIIASKGYAGCSDSPVADPMSETRLPDTTV